MNSWAITTQAGATSPKPAFAMHLNQSINCRNMSFLTYPLIWPSETSQTLKTFSRKLKISQERNEKINKTPDGNHDDPERDGH